MGPTLISIVLIVAGFLFIIELLRRHRLRERFAVMWFLLALILLVFAIFPHVLFALSHAMGFRVGSNFIFFCSIIILMGIVLQLSSAIGHAEERIRTLIEANALLEDRVRELEVERANSSVPTEDD